MDLWKFVGILGVVTTSAQLFPQVIKSLRTRKVRDLSLGMSVAVALSGICWLSYGIHLNDYNIIIANTISMIAATILFFLKIRENKEEED